MKKHIKLVVATILSIGILAGCQSSEEKDLQGTWDYSQGGVSLTFDDGKLEQKFADGSGSEKEYEIKDKKENGEFTIVEHSKDSNGKKLETEYVYKFSKDKKTLWSKYSDYYYEKVED